MDNIPQNKEHMKNKRKRKMIAIILLILAVIIIIPCIAIGIYMIKNTYEYQWDMDKVWRVGFEEKQVAIDENSILNYAEGPDNGPALLLIHGQASSWKSYSKNLPKLSKYYHIYAVDYYGQGGSSWNQSKYSANAIGKDLAWFIENVIGEKTIVSGHSSGGLLTAWLAANAPEDVAGIVLEDPPFFSCEDGRKEKTHNYNDLSSACNTFLNQKKETDFALWYFDHQYIWNMISPNAKEPLCRLAHNYREKHPDKMLVMSLLPQSWMGVFNEIDNYDPAFGLTFYDGSWNKGFDHAETLAKINCPAILIHADWSYSDDGILLGAMDDKDADRAASLMKNSTLINVHSMHCVHALKPSVFDKIMINFLDEVK